MADDSLREHRSALYVDMGTTNIRVWWIANGEILARAQAGVGVRDTARTGSTAMIRATLRDLLSRAPGDSTQRTTVHPTCVVAAGMITSPLGLAVVPHVPAPAGPAELAAGVPRLQFEDITPLPFLLIPGVCVGPPESDGRTIGEADVMRGEETLSIGLYDLGWLPAEATLLNLGSHWKAIRLDALGRIATSLTSLSGELIHAVQTQTILASSVPHERPQAVDAQWLEAGMAEQRRSGLARALFCVRLLEQRSRATAEDRLAFLIGAFIAADLDALRAKGTLAVGRPVVISGGGGLGAAWEQALVACGIRATRLGTDAVERAFLVGMQKIVALSQPAGTPPSQE